MISNSILFLAIVMFAAYGFAAEKPYVNWDIDVGVGDEIYPSVIIAESNMRLDEEEEDPNQLGDPFGVVGVIIEAPHDNTKIVVTVSSTKIISESKFEGALPEEGQEYFVYPILKHDYDTLLSVRQPFPEVVTVAVEVDGKPAGEKSKRVTVHSINDVVWGYDDEDEQWVNTAYLAAAYVNENHPAVDEILGEALETEIVDSFSHDPEGDEVETEMEAVYQAIQNRGFKYSSISTPSLRSKSVMIQYVRLMGDSLKTSQANCIDGSVLFASVLRKIKIEPVLVFVPGHAFLCAYLKKDHSDRICLETTMVGYNTFEEAVEAGNEEYEEVEEELNRDDDQDDYDLVDVEDAREMGIVPIREPSAEE